MKKVQVSGQLDGATERIFKKLCLHLFICIFGMALPIFVYVFLNAQGNLLLGYIEAGIFYAWGGANAITFGGITIPREDYLKLSNKLILKVFILISLVFIILAVKPRRLRAGI